MAVARSVVEGGYADEVWMMPCRRNPLKTDSDPWDPCRRIRLIEEAVCYYSDDRIKVSRQELEMPEPSYTVDTLRSLMEKYPDFHFRLIVGADSYLNFNKWKDWKWIEANARPIVYPRPGYHIESLRPRWTELKGVGLHDISSSQIREMIEEGKDVEKWMPWHPQHRGNNKNKI